MGSYCQLTCGGLYIGSSKDNIDPLVMTLYREGDKHVRRLVAGTPEYEKYYEAADLDDEVERMQVTYEITAAVARDRLEVMGFTLETVRRAFVAAVHRRLSELEEWAADDSRDLWTDDIDFFRRLTPDTWLEALREIRKRGLKPFYWRSDDELEQLPPLLKRMLRRNDEYWYGCPVYDVRHAIRLALQTCELTDSLVYDLTDLISGGDFDDDDSLTEYADGVLTADFASTRRVVVLTEGSTDKWVLEEAITLLSPSIRDYFSFMDFDNARIAGGAGALASTVKAFVGAGILNRVVAIFDNDTAASEALRSLDEVRLPSNFVVMQYPDLPLARSYPTLGPSGIVEMDVNGMAASIELYLGREVLTDSGGSLIPVQWKGYNNSVGKYQGEVLRKSEILGRFREKLTKAKSLANDELQGDWEGLQIIINRLKTAFAAIQQEEHLELEKRQY
ncbi:MAG TPA: HEPN/Toprim-associated domain-containing protein [Terriglobia bacterium]|nr:HEPN/Toprim-associated domain-containing protein [Terriglobia bacterium]